MRLLGWLAVTAVAIWALLRNRCRHVDEHGDTVVMLQWYDGRERGWCPFCHRFTRGWPNNPPQGARLPRARLATPEEVAKARAQLLARRRLNARMRDDSRGAA